MSKYTTLVRYICETESGLIDGKVNDVIAESWDKVFDFDFPIWDENYRQVLCSKILKHYYTREIGLETVGLWKLKLDTKMNEIMPYYNERYLSTTYKYNPLFDVDYYRTTKGTDDGTNSRHGERTNLGNETGLTNGQSKTISKFSDTPQGGLIGIENNEYLTSATINESSGSNDYRRNSTNNDTTQEVGSFNTTKDYIEHVHGKMPGFSYGKAIKEYRDNLINIDNEIIDELKDLFMLIW